MGLKEESVGAPVLLFFLCSFCLFVSDVDRGTIILYIRHSVKLQKFLTVLPHLSHWCLAYRVPRFRPRLLDITFITVELQNITMYLLSSLLGRGVVNVHHVHHPPLNGYSY